MFMCFVYCVLLCTVFNGVDSVADGKLENVFAWKQIGYDFDGVRYTRDSDFKRNPNVIYFEDEIDEKDKFFIQYNNVPIGMEIWRDKVFISVPRRRFGIPSTLNYVTTSSSTPLLRPFRPAHDELGLYSVYRPRVDRCDRLWVVDTGLLEAPDARNQVYQPSIVVYDLKTWKMQFRYYLSPSDLLSNRTSGGLTSITVDVSPSSCEDAHAYITDLATEGILVFSLQQQKSWRIDHPSFRHEEKELNFTVAGFTVNWRDGLFSIALSDHDASGSRTVYYHPLVSGQEYSVINDELKRGGTTLANYNPLGYRGPLTQSGSHAYHSDTATLLFANVAQDAILCWNVETPLTPEYVAIVAQDHEQLVYISDLKIVNDDVWVLANQMPVFVFSTLKKDQPNFFVHKGKIKDLIKGTPCDQDVDERNGQKKQKNME